MGIGLIDFYNNKIKREWKLAFYSAFFLGICVHLYKFTNTLPNHDALYNTYCNQNMINLGRWLLAPACMFSSFFDLPWITGLFSSVFLALSVVALIELFNIKNPVVIFIISGLMVSFPAISETYFFEYTSDGYMVAMLIASIAVICSVKERVTIKNILISIICICCACGIYQAYVAYAAVLVLCYLIYLILTENREDKEILLFIRNQIIVFGTGLALYILVWKLLCRVEGISPSGYEGIDSVGKIGIGVIVNAIKSTIKEFVQFFIKWDIRSYGFNVWIVLSIMFLCLFVAIMVIAIMKSGIMNKKLKLVILLVSLLLIPFAAFMWFFTAEGVVYNVRMEQSLCLLYVLATILCDRFFRPKWANYAAVLLVIIVLNNALIANIYYYYMNRAYEKGYSIAQEVLTRIHMADDGNVKEIAVIGEMDGFEYEDYKTAGLLGDLGPLYVVDYSLAGNATNLALFMSNYLDFSLAYYRNNEIDMPVYKPIDSTAPISEGWEVRFPYVREDEFLEIKTSQEVKNMSVWPSMDSVKVIGDVVVIKFSEDD